MSKPRRRYCKDCARDGIEQRVYPIEEAAIEGEADEYLCPTDGPLEESETITADELMEHEERSRYWARRPGFQCEPGGGPI